MRKNFLEDAQALRLKLENQTTLDDKAEKEIRELFLRMNSYIDAFTHISRSLKRQLDSIDQETNEICLVRDLISNLKGKK